jgi:hypothetical protein
VRRIIGLGGRFKAASKKMGGKPLFLIEDGSARAVIIEWINTGGTPKGVVPASSRTVILRNYTGSPYSAPPKLAKPCKVFLDDFCGTYTHFGKGCRAWAWQLNSETRGYEYNVMNDGGVFWLMGIKTEGGHTSLVTRNGGWSEVLGSYIYNNRGAKARENFIVDNAHASFVAGRSSFPVPVKETRGGQTKQMGKDEYTDFFAGYAKEPPDAGK